ncbi:DarT ssDNA thymidine ADP-ribosyltransferase family protein [Candidatus Leptofilum sp.]|uniref:DarT ssDNA thymidine ADP-ribosyltransferase family protein n=1 Tax=Candidatus Leptofilum sp. TaxID=3241576 RepID=UPI003B5CEE04
MLIARFQSFSLFDSEYILTLDGCQFSDGGLGSPRARYLSNASDLKNLPWKKIYHTGRFDPSKEDITFRRSAEVLVPNSLELNALRYIYCRSQAEKETLLQLLEPNNRRKYRNKVAATSRSTLFFRKHTFIQTGRLSAQSATFDFSPETSSPGPFNLKIEVQTETQNGAYEINNFMVKPNQNFSISFRRKIPKYTIRVKLDNYLAFANSFEEVDIPF